MDAPDLTKFNIRETAKVTIHCDQKNEELFYPPSETVEFTATVFSLGTKTDPSNVALRLKATKEDPDELPVYFAVYLVDVQGTKRFVKGFNWLFFDKTGHFFEPIISRAKLDISGAELKPNGHLKVCIEASILELKTTLNPIPQAILDAVSVNNFAQMVKYAHEYRISELKQKCTTFFSEHQEKITEVAGWDGENMENIRLILEEFDESEV